MAEEHPHVDQDMYKAVEVKQGEYFEVVLKNNDLKSVLTWDFDVLNMDVKFTVLRTMGLSRDAQRAAVQEKRASSRTSVLQENKLIEDGVDFFREEPTLNCRPKESVQVGYSFLLIYYRKASYPALLYLSRFRYVTKYCCFIVSTGFSRNGHERHVHLAVALSRVERGQSRKCSITLLLRGVELGEISGLYDQFAVRFLGNECGQLVSVAVR